jgi:hypothetical protein
VLRWLDVHDRTVLVHKGLDDLFLRLSLCQMRVDIIQHAFGSFAGAGECPARMRAAARAHVAAAAHAFEVYADLFGLIGIGVEIYGNQGHKRKA